MDDDTITARELIHQLTQCEGQTIHNGTGFALAILRRAKLARTDPLLSRDDRPRSAAPPLAPGPVPAQE